LPKTAKYKILDISKKTTTYIQNQIHRIGYADAIHNNKPIGSGVTEATCKILVKQRMCQASMRWKQLGVVTVICSSSLLHYRESLEKFLEKNLSQYKLDETKK
jgi:hypothetical protein